MTDQGWTVRPGPVPALLWPDDENPDMPFSLTEGDLAAMLPDALDRQVAAAFAAMRDALARDAQVREIVAGMEPDPNDYSFLREWAAFDEIAALYPSPGDRDDSEER